MGNRKQKIISIKKFVKDWMDGHEPDTFVKNEHGAFVYSAGCSSLNLVCFFESLLEDYIDELKLQNIDSSLFNQIEILANIYSEREAKAFDVADHLKAYENNIKNKVVENIILMIKNDNSNVS